MKRTIRVLAVGALAAAGLTLGMGSASAHVTVNPSTAAPGSYSVLTFRVPNESDDAGTVGLTITIPAETPLASVRYRAVPGWTAEATKEKLPKPVQQGDLEITEAVTSVTFTADDGVRIGPGEFAEFDLSVGPLPDVESLSFPTDQTYDNGDVVSWADPMGSGGEEPEHPAPLLTLAADAGGESGHSHGSDSDSDSEASVSAGADQSADAAGGDGMQVADGAQNAGAAADATDNTGRVLGVAGIVVGALGLLVAAFALRRPNRASK